MKRAIKGRVVQKRFFIGQVISSRAKLLRMNNKATCKIAVFSHGINNVSKKIFPSKRCDYSSLAYILNAIVISIILLILSVVIMSFPYGKLHRYDRIAFQVQLYVDLDGLY